MKKLINVNLIFDSKMWIAESDEPGINLVLESGSLDALVERVKIAVQDILETEENYFGEIEFHFQAERVDRIRSREAAIA